MNATAREEETETLAALQAHGLLRTLQPRAGSGGRFHAAGRTWFNFASNDYLALAHDEAICTAAAETVQAWGAGATASRLVTGDLTLHAELESELAALLGQESALVFGSGFLANLGVLTALCGRDTVVFGDRLNHASLVDGMRLAGARWHRYRHCDVDHLAERMARHPPPAAGRAVIVTDSVFSMDGDRAPLAAIADLARERGALLIVDEAHALGVLGPTGAGLAAEQGVVPDIVTGGFGKALGSYGGFAACRRPLRELLVNRARSFIYTTGLPPASVAATRAALARIRDHGGALGAELLARAGHLHTTLTQAGFDLGPLESQILPVPVGDNHVAVALAETLAEAGIIAPAMRPPTVPPGTARLRLSVTLAHGYDTLDHLATVLAEVARRHGLVRS